MGAIKEEKRDRNESFGTGNLTRKLERIGSDSVITVDKWSPNKLSKTNEHLIYINRYIV